MALFGLRNMAQRQYLHIENQRRAPLDIENREEMTNIGNNPTALLLDAKEGARLLGIGERFFWAMHSTGELGPLPIKLGKRTLWSRFELTEWVKARCPRREAWVNRKEVEHATV